MSDMHIDEFKDGQLIQYCVDTYEKQQDADSLMVLLRLLINLKVFIPVKAFLSNTDESWLRNNSCVGGTFTNNDPIPFEPDILVETNNKKWFPVFTADFNVPEDLKHYYSIIKIPGIKALKLAHSMDEAFGITINPGINDVFLSFRLADVMFMMEPFDIEGIDNGDTEIVSLRLDQAPHDK